MPLPPGLAFLLIGVPVLLLFPRLALADSMEDSLLQFSNQLKESLPGSFHLASRLRYEVFRNGPVDRAGFSLRARYGYSTPAWKGLSAFAEGESLWPLSHASSIHPLDQAGRGSELNQAWIQVRDSDLGSLRIGRQVFALDHHRFIGHVGWRQNQQSFDALTAIIPLGPKGSAQGFFLDRVHRVTGQSERLQGWGIHLQQAFAPIFSLTAFAYSLDFPNQPAWSNDTTGLSATGTLVRGDWAFDYRLAWAYQVDHGGSLSRSFGLPYYSLESMLSWREWSLGGAIEVLRGDGREGFRTPLATVHAFHGFADVFLPLAGFPQGLIDGRIEIGYRIPFGKGVRLRWIHHWFRPATGSGRYGKELDAVATWTINRHLELVVKYGRYRPAANALAPGHLPKTMFTTELNFSF